MECDGRTIHTYTYFANAILFMWGSLRLAPIITVFFGVTKILYSPSLYQEGIKNALCYKFRRLRIGRNCRAVCTDASSLSRTGGQICIHYSATMIFIACS